MAHISGTRRQGEAGTTLPVQVAELRGEAQRLAALDKVKSDCLDLVSHELRSPIGVARGYVTMLQDGSLGAMSPRAAAVLPVVIGKLDEMSRLVDQMLDTARLDDSRLDLDLRRSDVGGLAAQAVRSTPTTPRHNVVFDDDGLDAVCLVDAARVLTVIRNLLDNAVKYSPAGGEVRCAVRRDGDVLCIAVHDHGIGVDEAGKERLFTRFGRVGNATEQGIPGTGLGLYLSRELARRQGGDIEVESRLGAGSTFTLRLPLYRG